MLLILLDRFWVVHIPFVRMVRLQFLAQFPVDHRSHPIVSCIYTLSVLICCIRLLCNWSFRFYHYVTYICCFVASYLFLLWYDWSLWPFIIIIIVIIIILLFWEFFTPAFADSFSLEFEWLQVSRSLLHILVDLINKTVVRIVSAYPLISKSSNPFANPLGIVPCGQITIDITITFMFHSFF